MTADVNRLAYLQAMEIDVWRERGAQEVSDSTQVGQWSKVFKNAYV